MKQKVVGKLGNKYIFAVVTLIAALIIIPIGFNFLFIWESGYSRGNTGDWFVLYGNIFGGLIGGFFTYLALLLTLNNQRREKSEEMRPRIDIPHKSIDFIEGADFFSNQIAIELNNTGGTIAKNIECKLSLLNFDKVISTIEKNKNRLQVELNSKSINSVGLIEIDETGKKTSLGTVNRDYNSTFIGSCIPLLLNHDSKVNYLLEHNVNSWIDYIAKHRSYSRLFTNDDIFNNELFTLRLEVKYSSAEFGEFTDVFKLEWDFVGIWGDSDGLIKYQYVLKSKLDNE